MACNILIWKDHLEFKDATHPLKKVKQNNLLNVSQYAQKYIVFDY